MAEFIIDIEGKNPNDNRRLRRFKANAELPKVIEYWSKYPISERVVQYINADTGETSKGPKYDITKQQIEGAAQIEDFLRPGVKQQDPYDPIQYEPRDRFQENKNMSTTKEKFQSLVKECLSELKEEKSQREKLKESLRPLVQKVLREITNVGPLEKDKDELEKIRRGGFNKSPLYSKGGSQERLDVTNEEKATELEKIVKDIDKDWLVYWDDHNQLNVDAKNMGRIRIAPKYENNFDIDFMVKLVDRIRAISLTWDQVKLFVKENLKNLKGNEGNKTKSDTLKEKSLANKVDNDKNNKAAGPKNDLVKNRFEDPEHTKIKDTPKKDNDYNEKDVKEDDDQPDQPMKTVDVKDKNKKIDKTTQVKPRKHDNSDKSLKTTLPKTKKFKKRS